LVRQRARDCEHEHRDEGEAHDVIDASGAVEVSAIRSSVVGEPVESHICPAAKRHGWRGDWVMIAGRRTSHEQETCREDAHL
jgi:hypothetical protein